MKLRDRDAGRVYQIEDLVWDSTVLMEKPGFNTLVSEAEAVLNHPLWNNLIREETTLAQLSSTTMHGMSSGDQVAFGPDAHRYVVPHELAHRMDILWESPEPHGPDWRAAYIWLVELMYGDFYSEELRCEFVGNGLSVASTVEWPTIKEPIFPDELFEASTREFVLS